MTDECPSLKEVDELRNLVKDLIRLPSVPSFDCYGCRYDEWVECRDGCLLLRRAEELGIGGDEGATELISCPFCGGEAHMVEDCSGELGETRWSVWHECDGCKGENAGYGQGYHPWFETPWYKTKAEALNAWNRRA